jgi:hypothetical protein
MKLARTSQAAVGSGLLSLNESLDASGVLRYLMPPTSEEDAFSSAHRGDSCMQTPCGARWAVWLDASCQQECRLPGRTWMS